MKKIALGLVLVSTLAFGQSKKVTSSNVHWWGYKVMKSEGSSHDGTVDVKSGFVTLKKNQVVGGTFVLDMTSINAVDVTGNMQTKLNAHLKDGDFFEVDKYPTATFQITSVKKNKSTDFTHTISGKLTVKGKTNTISFPAMISIDNGEVKIKSNKFSFDRQKFDITYKSSMKDLVIKDEVDMTVELTAN